jgi:hypothetical protein
MAMTILSGTPPVIAGLFDDVEQEFAGTRRTLSAFPDLVGAIVPGMYGPSADEIFPR